MRILRSTCVRDKIRRRNNAVGKRLIAIDARAQDRQLLTAPETNRPPRGCLHGSYLSLGKMVLHVPGLVERRPQT